MRNETDQIAHEKITLVLENVRRAIKEYDGVKPGNEVREAVATERERVLQVVYSVEKAYRGGISDSRVLAASNEIFELLRTRL